MIHKHRRNRRLAAARKAHHKLDILEQYWDFSSETVPSYGTLDKAKVNSYSAINIKSGKPRRQTAKDTNLALN